MIQDYESKEAIQYIAGLVDAEGYFRLRLHPNRDTALGADFKLEMTSLKSITFASRVLGIKKINIQDRGSKRKRVYNISTGKSGRLKEIIELLHPYLNEKRNQASIIREYLKLDLLQQKLIKDIFFKRFNEYKYQFEGDIFFSFPYLAGLLDGDGIISITQQKTNNLYLGFGLEQCFREFPEYLYKKFGGSFQVRKKRKDAHRDTYVWMCKHQEAKLISQNCSNFMIEKKEKARLVIDVINLKEDIKNFRKKRTDEILSNYKLIQ